jgi:F420-non-reducing hydrogenase iron-sulfur subunit
MCSSRVDPRHILEGFKNGADGILIGGCHPGDCHYVKGNYKTKLRVLMLEKLLGQLGIERERVRLEWISASEGKKFAKVIDEFTEEIRELGPIK